MNITLVFFILAVIVFVLGSFFFNFKRGLTIQATLLGVGFLLMGILFGLRWFGASGEVAPATWPPSLNSCPDFLTLYKMGSTYVCVDAVGVSNGGMSQWTDATQTDDKYVFNLFTDQNSKTRIQSLCDQAIAKKVTWEGVYDGSTCLGREPPAP
jgi:hypothetical protein